MNAVGMQPTGKVRGTIIKVPDNTPGIVFANGEQKFFSLGGVWKSPVAPAANMVVEVAFDASGAIASLTVVDPHQVNKERLDHLSGAAQQHGKEAAALAKQGIGALAARMGAVQLGAAAFIVVAFFFFPTISIAGMFGTKGTSFSFWEALGFDRALGPVTTSSHGIVAILGLACIAAPFVVPFLKFPWSNYLNAAPLAIVILGTLVIRSELAPPSIPGIPSAAAREIAAAASDFYSYGWGLYVLGLAALVLAVLALKSPKQGA